MRITIFGASGGTGRRLLEQAIAAGHDVTAVVRKPLPDDGPGLTVIRADVLDAEAIRPAVAGQDAVITAIGARTLREPTSIQTDSTTSILRAMKAEDVRRFLAISNSGMVTDGDDPLTKTLVKPILRRIFRHTWEDMRQMEVVVRASTADWTLLRPPMLTNAQRTGAYRTATERNVRAGFRLTRADLADCALACLNDSGSVGSAIAVAR